MKRTAIYLRVSSKQQDVASQEPDLRRYADTLGEPVEWYSDQFSGRTMDRPGWNRLMEDVRLGQIGRVVVWRLDRIGRTARGLTALFEELHAAKVNVVSLKDGLDLSTPAGRLMANVLASVAQFETEVRRERVLAGQSVAKSRGKRWGGSRKGRRTSQSASPEQIETILKLRAERVPVARIARAVALSRPTVYAHLQA